MKACFGTYITKYFGEYLPHQKGVSQNTLKSYRDTFIQLIEFVGSHYGINCNKLEIEDLSEERIQCFLDYIEQTRHVSISTKNQRLATIHSFYKYLQKQDFSYYQHCNEVLRIEFKRINSPVMHYMSIEEVKLLLSSPDIHNRKEFRDLTIMALLYETGCRVQELIDLCLKNITFGSCPTVLLTGKGNKSRLIPIGKDMVKILRKYISDNNIIEPCDILFKNKQNFKLTRVGVQYIINKYIMRCRTLNNQFFRTRVTNHSFRHSKAMHLLEAGVNLMYIRDFLGHTSVTTTEVYAKINPEIKRKVITQHSVELKAKTVYDKNDKNDLLKWLKNNM